MPQQLSSSEKTPIATLHEFCMQNEEILMFDENVPHATDPKMFSCVATAFDLSAIGSGRSKKVARHEACAELIAQLASLDRFKQNFQKLPVTPRPTFDTDAVMALRNICVQRNWPFPTFELMQSYGQPHVPMFTYVCQMASIKRTGVASKKSGAKQIAIRAVIDVVQNFEQNEERIQIATIDAKQSEEQKQTGTIDAEPLLTFRELIKSRKKLWTPRVSDRQNYFLQLPKKDRNEAEQILMDNSSATHGTSKNQVDLTCAALKLKYNVIDIPNHQQECKVFYLRGNHDCVIAAKEEDLYDRVIAHFKTILNLQKF
ncbi:uncharacterized protein LOC129576291 [Sitodiplosis mosellana]|uniref:uncharacterized protein LOC129576291 n=1 Tax=Sitodiplosis mosellana TaxID=263140 RepID=UPI0024438725|nr:uncharacterized protein LOC129576291 [Sitodiplosis mosellana]